MIKEFDKEEKIIVEIEGEEVLCDVLFTFDVEELNTTYIAITDNLISEDGYKNVYVLKMDENGTLHKVTSKEEIELVNNVMEDIANS